MNCGRQVGKSETAGALVLKEALLNAPALILILSRTDRQSGELLRAKIKPLYAALGKGTRFARGPLLEVLHRVKANYYPNPNQYFPSFWLGRMFHGLKDWALLPGALNDTWKWVEKDLTLITIPEAGHFVHRDASQFVTKRMVSWLVQEPAK